MRRHHAPVLGNGGQLRPGLLTAYERTLLAGGSGVIFGRDHNARFHRTGLAGLGWLSLLVSVFADGREVSTGGANGQGRHVLTYITLPRIIALFPLLIERAVRHANPNP